MTHAALAQIPDDPTDETRVDYDEPQAPCPADPEADLPSRRGHRWWGWQEPGYGFDNTLGGAPARLDKFLGLALTLLSSPQQKDGPLLLPLAAVSEGKRAVLMTRSPSEAPTDVLRKLANNVRLTDGEVTLLRYHMRRAVSGAWSIRGGGLQAILAAHIAAPFVGTTIGASNPLVREVHSRQSEAHVNESAVKDFLAEQHDFFPLLVAFDSITRTLTSQAQTKTKIEFRPGWLLGGMTAERVAVAIRRGHRIALVNPWWLQEILDTARNNDAAWTAACLTVYLEAAFVAASVVGGPRLSADSAQDLVVHLAAASADQLPHIERLLRRCFRAHTLLLGDKLIKRRTVEAIEKQNAAIKAGRQRLPLTRDMLTALRALCREQHALTGLALWAEVADYSAEQLCDVCAAVAPADAFKAISAYVLRSAT